MAQVLIVDDDEPIRQSMRIILEDIGGHTVIEAKNGMEALEILRTSKERLVVVLDVLMPELNGIELLRTVMADAELSTRHAYILATVSRTDPEELSQRFPLGVSVVSKPFDLDDLLDGVSVAAEGLQNETNRVQDNMR